MVRLIINGNEHTVDEPSGRTLLDALREDLTLAGAKCGCGQGQCGACTVLLDRVAVRACMVDLETLDGNAVTTVEGLARQGHLHAVQAAFIDARSLQCGYCTPGMVMSVVALLARDQTPTDAAIQHALAGNICRCGGYPRILQAVHAAAAVLQRGGDDGSDTGQIPVAEAVHDCATGADLWTVVLPPAQDDQRAGREWGWTTTGGARLSIDTDGRITAFTGKVDGGQGNRVALTRVIAAELATSTSMIRLQMGDTACVPFDMGTFGSRSLPDAGHALRLTAVAGRRELLAEAARRWQCSPDDLLLADGAVCDRGGDRKIAYGALVGGDSRTIRVDPDDPLQPASPGLTDVDGSTLRDALIAATTGAKQFPSDLLVPNMLYASVLRPPAYGATLGTVDTTAARRMPGVSVVQDGDFVAVCAPTRAAASVAVRSLQAHWEYAAQPAEADLISYLRSHPAESTGWEGPVDRDIGDVDKVPGETDICLTATYTCAYIAHVPMEPRVALAQLDGDVATVWVGTQRPFGVRGEVAAALGLSEEQVRIVVPDFGGGFGGKHTGGVAVEAARLAQATGRPVKVCWTREEEFRWAYFRPAAVIDVRSTATRDGNLVSWEFTNINSGAAGLFSPYNVPNQRERFQPARSPLPQGSYRALAATANHFARESHIDEVAAQLQVDPLELRLSHLSDSRLTDALRELAERIDWQHRPSGAGRGVGIAGGIEKDARVATAAEVMVDPDGVLHVLRIATVFDCGAVVDPDGLRSQIAGATVMGLGGALFEAIHFEDGQILNPSLATYRVPRFADVPPIDITVLDRPDIASAGAGETPIIAVAPAIANAIHAATGRRIRFLPLAPDGLV